MCEYTQVQYYCDHLRFRVQRWCSNYERTHKVCQPNVTTAEYRADEVCSDCRPHSPPAWEWMIRRGNRRAPYV